MSSVYLSSSEFPKIASAVAVGAFDGFHLGHQKVLSELFLHSRRPSLATVIYTFRRNPKLTTRGIHGLLSTNSERVEYADRWGVGAIIMEDFTPKFQALSPASFVQDILIGRLNARVVVVGENFQFGKARCGDIVILKRLLEESGRTLIVVPSVEVDGQTCSSSIIRSDVMRGSVEMAARFLGRFYSIEGVIVTGNQIGGQLGFPTANIEVSDPVKLLPGDGVYVVRVMLDGEIISGVCNIGVRPTIARDSRRTVEAHLLNFRRRVYGHLAKVEFVSRIRDEVRFPSAAALARQIQQDTATARRVLESFNRDHPVR